jgi:hypothetical protein
MIEGLAGLISIALCKRREAKSQGQQAADGQAPTKNIFHVPDTSAPSTPISGNVHRNQE